MFANRGLLSKGSRSFFFEPPLNEKRKETPFQKLERIPCFCGVSCTLFSSIQRGKSLFKSCNSMSCSKREDPKQPSSSVNPSLVMTSYERMKKVCFGSSESVPFEMIVYFCEYLYKYVFREQSTIYIYIYINNYYYFVVYLLDCPLTRQQCVCDFNRE